MKTLEELCTEISALSEQEKNNLFIEKAKSLEPVLDQLNTNNINGYTLFGSFVIASIIADGKLAKEEVGLLTPFYQDYFKDKVDKQDVVRMARKYEAADKDADTYLKSMLDLLGSYDCTVKEDILTCCVCVLAIDGVITDSEKAWLEKIA